MRSLTPVLLLLAACSAAEPLPPTGTLSTETLWSDTMDDAFILRIRLPPDADEDAAYPVVFQLDPTFAGARQFDHTVGLVSAYEAEGTWPEAIVVGIDYDDPASRFRDYTPTLPLSEDFDRSDGADRFHAALRDDILPFVDDTLPADPDLRILQGHSNGGSFAWYAALRHRDDAPSLFHAHVAADSGIPQWMFTMERWLAEAATDLPIRFYASRATDNGSLQAATLDGLVERLRDRDHPSLALTVDVFETDHAGSLLPSYEAGLTFAFEEVPCICTLLTLLFAGPTQASESFVTPEDAVGRDLHLRLDTDATWGIGAQMYLGALVHAEGQLAIWHTGPASGTFDLGLRVAYGNEPGFFAPWNDPEEIQGAGHRVATQLALGTTVHLSPQRRLGLGLHLLAGHNVVVQDYTLTYAREDFTAEQYDVRHSLIFSGDLTVSYRLTPRVGLNLALTAPLPTASSYVVGLVQVGLGASWYLR